MQKDTYFHTSVREKLVARREFDIQFDKFVVKLLNGEETVSHLPREHSRIARYFLTYGGLIAVVEVSGHQRNGDSLLSDVWALSRQR